MQQEARLQKFYQINGEIKTIPQLSREYGIKAETIRKRLRSGMSMQDALTKKIQKFDRKKVGKKEKKCNTCIYRFRHSSQHEVYCQYVLIKLERRNCPVIGCTKYEYDPDWKKQRFNKRFTVGLFEEKWG